MQDHADIKELAVATWRLEKWLENLNSDRKMAARSALRSIKKYIAALAVEVVDPVGSKFDPGLAIEVVNNETPDALEEDLIIIETLSPYVYQSGELIQYARVIIGTLIKETKKSTEIVEKVQEIDTIEQSVITTESGSSKEKHKSKTDEESEIIIHKDDIERMMEYAKIL